MLFDFSFGDFCEIQPITTFSDIMNTSIYIYIKSYTFRLISTLFPLTPKVFEPLYAGKCICSAMIKTYVQQ